MRAAVTTILIGLVVVACSPATTTNTSAPTTTAPEGTTTVAPTTTLGTTTSAPAETTTTERAPDVIVNGDVVDSPGRIEVVMGDVVEVTVLADVDDAIHVHGYDLTFPTVRGVPTLVTFTADAQGIFEVELEEAGIPLFELVVAP